MRTFFSFLASAPFLFVIAGCSGGNSLTPSQRVSTMPAAGAAGPVSVDVHRKRAPATYRLIDLGANFAPSRINAKNVVSGTIGSTPLTHLAAVYDNGKVTAFARYPGQTASEGNDINDDGSVVGSVELPEGASAPLLCQHAALFHANAPPTLYYTCACGEISTATGINDTGEIVGYATGASCDQTAIFSGGSTTLLSSDGVGEPASVNKTGTTAATQFNTFVGSCLAGSLLPVEFNPSFAIPLPSDATVGGETQSATGVRPFDINDKGDVVGAYDSCVPYGPCGTVGFVYASGVTTGIHSPDQQAASGCVVVNGINNAGRAVGTICESNSRAILVAG